ncbi:MAG: IPT/TIG domain-containing protein [Planctomycetota bacterium]|jgi:hypothetical protein
MGKFPLFLLLFAVVCGCVFGTGCAKTIKMIMDLEEEVTEEEEPPPPPAPPQILFIYPGMYPVQGNVQMEVRGFDFQAGCSLLVDGVSCTNVVWQSSILVTGDVPAHAEGTADVTVINPDTQSATAPNAIQYTSGPIIMRILPDRGTEAGGTNLALQGYNFQNGATVTIGGVPALNVVVVNPNLVTCDTPPNPQGSFPVTLTNPDTRFYTFNYYVYTQAAPVITSINPTQGSNMGGNPVTINGQYFVNGAIVYFGTIQSPGVVFGSSTQLTATVTGGPHAVGPVDVRVQNPDLQQDIYQSYTYIFTNPPPSVTSVVPNSGPTAGGTTVTITGADFQPGCTVMFGAYPPNFATFNSPTQITAQTGPATGISVATPVNVVVTNPDTQLGSLTGGFTYIPPAGNRMTAYVIDTSAGCDVQHYDFAANSALLQGDMLAVGLHTNGADGLTDVYVEDWLQAEILGYTSQYYLRNFDGTKITGTSFNICFVGVQPQTPWIPPPATTGPAQPFMYNIMHFGGVGPGGGTLGRAWVDTTMNAGMPANQRRESNTSTNGNGVYTGAISAGGTLSPALSASDRQFVDGSYWLGKGTAADDARFTAIRTRLTTWASRIATVSIHENAHSLGQVITTRAVGGHCSNVCPMRAMAVWGVTAWCTGASSCTAEFAASLGYSP